MKYAVVESGGKQYKVSEGDVLNVDLLSEKPGSSFSFKDVLLICDGDTVKVGTPFVSGALVLATVQSHLKGDKIKVSKFKAKVHYKRTIGFRPMYTSLKINNISLTVKPATNTKHS